MHDQLTELVKVLSEQQRQRWQKGDAVYLDDFVAQYPELLGTEELVQLVLDEIQLLKQFNAYEEEVRRTVYAELCGENVALLDQINELSDEVTGRFPFIPRYNIISEVGYGGWGVVYRALDTKEGGEVALKVLDRWSEDILAEIEHFKRESRLLEGTTNKHLVQRFELNFDGSTPFIVMEFIDGVQFLQHIRPGASFDAPHLPALTDDELRKLLRALRQLIHGVQMLHAMKIIHRDIKPPNVLVERYTNRVVIVDFGLAATLRAADEDLTVVFAGTIGYCAPEQRAEEKPTEASDWYSVGALIHHAMCGYLPSDEGPNGRSHDVPDNSISRRLLALSTKLLRTEKETRPTGPQVVAEIDQLCDQSVGPSSFKIRVVTPVDELVGRERHLRQLSHAFDQAEAGNTIAVLLHGKSGEGKTVLAKHFLDDLEAKDKALVLRGRCFHSESGEYKAVDEMVSNLRRRLCELESAELHELLPLDVSALAELFNKRLRQVPEIAETVERRSRNRHSDNKQDLRARGFASFRELITRLANKQLREGKVLVLAIDDLQWGDDDSAVLLDALLAGPDPPRLLFLACHRSMEEHNSILRVLLAPNPQIEQHDIRVGPLLPIEIRELAKKLLVKSGIDPTAQLIDQLETQSEYVPLFLEQLVAYLRTHNKQFLDATLADVRWESISDLPEGARRRLEILSIAKQPLPGDDAVRAAGLRGARVRKCVAVLKDGNWISTRASMDRPTSEVFELAHDSIRETIDSKLVGEQRKERFTSLAWAIDASSDSNAATFKAQLFEEAGIMYMMARYCADAADQAAEGLAFHHARMLYEQALKFWKDGNEGRHELLVKLASTLANLGLGPEAANTFLRAAKLATSSNKELQQRWRAAEQFLISGHVDDGLHMFNDVLTEVGMGLPKTPKGALARLILNRLRLHFRSRAIDPVPLSKIKEDALTRIDICWASTGMSTTDPIRGADFQARSLLFALKAREPYRIARALGAEAAHVSTAGPGSKSQVATLLDEATQWAKEIDDQGSRAHASGIIILAKGIADYMSGRWCPTVTHCDEASEVFRSDCKSVGVAWDRDTARIFALWALTHQGHVSELRERLPHHLSDARDRNDLYAEAYLKSFISTIVHLADDDAGKATSALDSAEQKWTKAGFYNQHHNFVLSRIHVDLYTNRGLEGLKYLNDRWRTYKKSLLLRVQVIYMEMLYLRACCMRSAFRGRRLRNLRCLKRTEADAQPIMQFENSPCTGNGPRYSSRS